jgi:hypothetical protein
MASRTKQAEAASCDEEKFIKSVGLFGEKRGIEAVKNKVLSTVREEQQLESYKKRTES